MRKLAVLSTVLAVACGSDSKSSKTPEDLKKDFEDACFIFDDDARPDRVPLKSGPADCQHVIVEQDFLDMCPPQKDGVLELDQDNCTAVVNLGDVCTLTYTKDAFEVSITYPNGETCNWSDS